MNSPELLLQFSESYPLDLCSTSSIGSQLWFIKSPPDSIEELAFSEEILNLYIDEIYVEKIAEDPL